jgi:hypothetical protein
MVFERQRMFAKRIVFERQEVFAISALLLLASCGCSRQQDLPLHFPAVITSSADGSCPTLQMRRATRDVIQQEVESRLLSEKMRIASQCPCGGVRPWRRIAYLNMSDPDNQQCPSGWRQIATPLNACGRKGSDCDSAIFPTDGSPYTRVCGRIIAIQKGITGAFHQSVHDRVPNTPGLENTYFSGVSLTHGTAGSRQHVWTFAAALYETDSRYDPSQSCPCTNTNFNWPYETPIFVGNNYFCATANTGPGFSQTRTYLEDPLWDGEGCGPASTCCQFNRPPWFCTTLPEPTTDDLELRICSGHISSSDIYIQLIDIFVN